MSFGKELRAKRQATLPLMALIATTAPSAPMVVPPPTATTSAQQTAPREFADTQTARSTRRTKKSVKRVKPRAGARWDGRKARRAILMEMAGLDNSGRQWVRVRKAIRRSAVAYLLNVPAWRLAELSKTQRLVRTG